MSQLATGAVHIWARPPAGAVTYFGTCEKMPQDVRNPEYEMLMNDLTGTKIPLDLAFEGVSAQVSLVMTRVNQPVVELMQNLPSPSLAGVVLGTGAGATAGSWSIFDYGSLMSLEGLAWEFWLGYSFGSAIAPKAVYTFQGLRPGRHYQQCIIWAPQADETGTAPMKQHFMLYAWPKLNMTTKRSVLYDYDFSAVNAGSIF